MRSSALALCILGLTLAGIPKSQAQTTPTIGSIEGRVVDSQTGEPLPGRSVPFAQVRLYFCASSFDCRPVGLTGTDAQGSFHFDGSAAALTPGNYQIEVNAEQYVPFQTGFLNIPEGDYDAGDLALESRPVRIVLQEPCTVPSIGGNCRFKVRISNGLDTRLEGHAWSLADSIVSVVPVLINATFQTGNPKNVSLDPGESATVSFSFPVPANLQDGTYVCIDTFVAQRPSQFAVLGNLSVLCLQKGAKSLEAIPEGKKRELLRRVRE
ncbi:MAG TPA: carboxypeptidase-like regulatory domain-containing protein [Thermoanaerobaculia bacterium]|nr:carboxypeptidase-like regulatory domain-containing protein [Thermoanaerobaculia bacterium]